jgi:hypothetical protein
VRAKISDFPWRGSEIVVVLADRWAGASRTQRPMAEKKEKDRDKLLKTLNSEKPIQGNQSLFLGRIWFCLGRFCRPSVWL